MSRWKGQRGKILFISIWIFSLLIGVVYLNSIMNMKVNLYGGIGHQIAETIFVYDENFVCKMDNGLGELKVSQIHFSNLTSINFFGGWDPEAFTPNRFVAELELSIGNFTLKKISLLDEQFEYLDLQITSEDGNIFLQIEGQSPKIAGKMLGQTLEEHYNAAKTRLVILCIMGWLGIILLYYIMKNCLYSIMQERKTLSNECSMAFSIVLLSIFVFSVVNGYLFYEYEYLFSFLYKKVGAVLGPIILLVLLEVCVRKNTKLCTCSLGSEKIRLVCDEKLLLPLLLVIALPIYFYNLSGDPSFHNDEHQTMESAMGFLETGKFCLWNFGVDNKPLQGYGGIWPYTFLLACIFKFTGPSIIAARALSGVFGIIFLILFYRVLTKFFKRREFAFLCCLIYLLNPFVIEMYRTSRMYSLGEVLALGLFYSAYCALTEKNNFQKKSPITQWIQKYINFKWQWCVVALVCCFFLYFTIGGGLTLGVGFCVYILYRYFVEKDSHFKYLVIVIFSVISLVAVTLILYYLGFESVVNWPVFRSVILHTGMSTGNQELYFWNSLDSPFGIIIGLILLFSGYVYCFENRRKTPVYMFMLIVHCTVLVFFVFFTTRYYQARYNMFMYNITFSIQILGVVRLISILSGIGKKLVIIIIEAGLVCCLLNFSQELYVRHEAWADFSPAYEKVAEDIDKRNDQVTNIYSYHPRYYYLTNLENVNYKIMSSYKDIMLYKQEWNYNNEIDELLDGIEESEGLIESGYIVFEEEKLSNASDIFLSFISFNMDQIAGEFDKDRVDIYKYNFVQDINLEDIEQENWDSDKLISEQIKDGTLYIRMSLSNLPSNSKVVSVKIRADKDIINNFQLIIPEGNEDYVYYAIPLDFIEGQTVDVGENIYVYDGDNMVGLNICMGN